MSGPMSLPGSPWREDVLLPLNCWTEKSGLPLSATTEPDLVVMATSYYGLKWDHGGAATDKARLQFVMPMHFGGPESLPKYDFKLIVSARKLDAASDENADLALAAGLSWFTPGVLSNPLGHASTVPTLSTAAGSSNSLTTAALATLATAVIAADNSAVTGFATYELDLGYRIRAESKEIKAGDIVSLSLYPHETVGSADMDLEVLCPMLRLRRCINAVPAMAKQASW
jgi:hypothetical protein